MRQSQRDHTVALYESALRERSRDALDAAFVVLKDLIETGEDDWYVLYAAGLCARLTERFSSACEYLLRASQLRPDEGFVFRTLGISLQLSGDYEGSMAALRRSIELEPDIPEAYNSAGLTRKLQGRFKDALGNYESAINALSVSILKDLTNSTASPVHHYQDTVGQKWVECAAYAALRCCSTVDGGAERMEWPTGEYAEKDERDRPYGGLYWVDRQEEGKKVRLFLTNFFNTFRERLRADERYAMFLRNYALTLGLLGEAAESEALLQEAHEFSG